MSAAPHRTTCGRSNFLEARFAAHPHYHRVASLSASKRDTDQRSIRPLSRFDTSSSAVQAGLPGQLMMIVSPPVGGSLRRHGKGGVGGGFNSVGERAEGVSKPPLAPPLPRMGSGEWRGASPDETPGRTRRRGNTVHCMLPKSCLTERACPEERGGRSAIPHLNSMPTATAPTLRQAQFKHAHRDSS